MKSLSYFEHTCPIVHATFRSSGVFSPECLTRCDLKLQGTLLSVKPQLYGEPLSALGVASGPGFLVDRPPIESEPQRCAFLASSGHGSSQGSAAEDSHERRPQSCFRAWPGGGGSELELRGMILTGICSNVSFNFKSLTSVITSYLIYLLLFIYYNSLTSEK